MHSIANTNKLYVLHSPPCKMLIFACPEGIKIHQNLLKSYKDRSRPPYNRHPMGPNHRGNQFIPSTFCQVPPCILARWRRISYSQGLGKLKKKSKFGRASARGLWWKSSAKPIFIRVFCMDGHDAILLLVFWVGGVIEEMPTSESLPNADLRCYRAGCHHGYRAWCWKIVIYCHCYRAWKISRRWRTHVCHDWDGMRWKMTHICIP